jgi:hypothetical protein
MSEFISVTYWPVSQYNDTTTQEPELGTDTIFQRGFFKNISEKY